MRYDAETRRKLAALKAQQRQLEKPARAAAAKARKAQRQARAKAMQGAPKEQRQERLRDNAYLAATRRLPCLAGLFIGGCEGPVEAAHLRYSHHGYGRINPGKARKSDDCWVNPLCRKHHTAQHDHGDEQAWWLSVVGFDPNPLCIERYHAHLAGEDGHAVLLRASPLIAPLGGATTDAGPTPGTNKTPLQGAQRG